MKATGERSPLIAIACGGTGGHLYPGVAVAGQLRSLGARVMLLVSPKEVDQKAVENLDGMLIHTLPVVGLQNRNYLSFLTGFARSFFRARALFKRHRPQAVLAMGGFTSAPPVVAARLAGTPAFLHESNVIPGRANRLLARLVREAFVGFSETAAHLSARQTTFTGTPVRESFSFKSVATNKKDAARCRTCLGLDPEKPVLLVVGGSQGAMGLNQVILDVLPHLKDRNWQWLHLTGPRDVDRVKAAYKSLSMAATVKPFLAEMDLALGSADACVSRAGASSLAEIACCRLPALLVPFPEAADNHQCANAAVFARNGAALMIEQRCATPVVVAPLLVDLMENERLRTPMQEVLAGWHAPDAARCIADLILQKLGATLEPSRDLGSFQPVSKRTEAGHS